MQINLINLMDFLVLYREREADEYQPIHAYEERGDAEAAVAGGGEGHYIIARVVNLATKAQVVQVEFAKKSRATKAKAEPKKKAAKAAKTTE